jgi:hypothetical protein
MQTPNSSPIFLIARPIRRDAPTGFNLGVTLKHISERYRVFEINFNLIHVIRTPRRRERV